jgi:hypothetical protein
MTPMQRRACLALRTITLGKFGPRRLIEWLVSRGESDRWESIKLTARQLARLARIHRKYRRQVGDVHVLFWSQRVLADEVFSTQEEPCQQS